MIESILFWTDENHVIETYNALKKGCGLVGILENNKIQNIEEEKFGAVLVWEDEKGVGRYRIHFYKNGHHPDGPLVMLRYWMNSKFTDEIKQKDPMKNIVKKVYEKLKNYSRITDYYDNELPTSKIL